MPGLGSLDCNGVLFLLSDLLVGKLEGNWVIFFVFSGLLLLFLVVLKNEECWTNLDSIIVMDDLAFHVFQSLSIDPGVVNSFFN